MDYKSKYEAIMSDIDVAILGARDEKTKIALENIKSRNTESEDERIRKFLLEYFGKMNPDDMVLEGVPFSHLIAWLEKQKEQRSCSKGGIPPLDYYQGIMEGRSDVIDHPEQFGLQKPAEWSEEDKEWIAYFERLLEFAYNKDPRDLGSCCVAGKMWLKSLRPQPKQEWSEEDDEMCLHIRLIVNMCNAKSSTIGPMLKWLNDLHKRCKAQPHWKPSEELKDLPKWKKTKPERGKAFGKGPWYGSGIGQDDGKHTVFLNGYEISVDELFDKLPKEE